jgi:AmmeMemoRadiSam system protein A
MEQELNEKEQEFLLALARKAIKHKLETGGSIQEKSIENKFLQKRGAFVTLKVKNELRGCIGYPLPVKPLLQAIVEMAEAAATQDYRFAPLKPEELKDTKIEISVLGVPQAVKDISSIVIGTHGIIVSKGSNKGLLLPQVPLEWNWDLETYLRQGCLKAGLDGDEWRKKAKIEVFTAQVFSE